MWRRPGSGSDCRIFSPARRLENSCPLHLPREDKVCEIEPFWKLSIRLVSGSVNWLPFPMATSTSLPELPGCAVKDDANDWRPSAPMRPEPCENGLTFAGCRPRNQAVTERPYLSISSAIESLREAWVECWRSISAKRDLINAPRLTRYGIALRLTCSIEARTFAACRNSWATRA